MARGDEAERAAIQIMDQRSKVIDQLTELMARMLENITQKRELEHAVISDREEKRETNAMNKFEIAEKYNELGKSQPKEFIKWLLANLSEQYRQILRDTLKQMLEMISHYEHAQRASEKKIHMPWDKAEAMVDIDHYMKQKQAYFESEMPGVLNTLGIKNKTYMAPEMITRAHVLEDYISGIYEESYKKSEKKLRLIDRRDFYEKRKRVLDSIDFGVAGHSFIFNMSGENVEIVIRPSSEVEELARAAGVKDHPYLLREEAITRNGINYSVIDPTNEVYRDIVVYEMFAKEKQKNQKQAVESTDSVKTANQNPVKEDTKLEKSVNEDRKKETQKENDLTRRKSNARNTARIMNIDGLFPANGLER